MRRFRVSAALGGAVLAAIFVLVPIRVRALSASNTGPITATTFIDVSKIVLPSVVSIEVKHDVSEMHRNIRERFQGQTPPDIEDFLRRFFGESPGGPGLSPEPGPGDEQDFTFKTAGSGFFFHVDGSTGYLMTNNHVIDDAKKGEISIILDSSLNDAEISGDKVQVLGTDTLGDLAVLKVDLGDIKVKPIAWGNSDALEIGEWVVALGNPLELRNSVTQGIVSAKHREINQTGIEDLLQTTAAINPGNSGGPLVNLDGKVVGINNAIATRTGMWQGVSFAIPSSYAQKIADQLLKTGKLTWGYLGIQMSDLTNKMAKYFNLESDEGIIVVSVTKGTAAEKAGLKPYDIITAVDGKPVKDTREMLRMIATKEVGSKVELTVYRREEGAEKPTQLTIEATLGERPSEKELASALGKPSEQAHSLADQYGLTFDTANPSHEGLKIKSVEPGSLAAKAGLRPGDVIVQINQMDVKTPDDFSTAIQKLAEGKEEHLVMFLRDGMNNFTTMPAAKQ